MPGNLRYQSNFEPEGEDGLEKATTTAKILLWSAKFGFSPIGATLELITEAGLAISGSKRWRDERSARWRNEQNVVVLGDAESGKTALQNLLTTGKPGSPRRTRGVFDKKRNFLSSEDEQMPAGTWLEEVKTRLAYTFSDDNKVEVDGRFCFLNHDVGGGEQYRKFWREVLRREEPSHIIYTVDGRAISDALQQRGDDRLVSLQEMARGIAQQLEEELEPALEGDQPYVPDRYASLQQVAQDLRQHVVDPFMQKEFGVNLKKIGIFVNFRDQWNPFNIDAVDQKVIRELKDAIQTELEARGSRFTADQLTFHPICLASNRPDEWSRAMNAVGNLLLPENEINVAAVRGRSGRG